MPEISRGDTERIQDEPEPENMSPQQKYQAVESVLKEMDDELTGARHSSDKSIVEEREGILEAYTERVLDLFE